MPPPYISSRGVSSQHVESVPRPCGVSRSLFLLLCCCPSLSPQVYLEHAESLHRVAFPTMSSRSRCSCLASEEEEVMRCVLGACGGLSFPFRAGAAGILVWARPQKTSLAAKGACVQERLRGEYTFFLIASSHLTGVPEVRNRLRRALLIDDLY